MEAPEKQRTTAKVYHKVGLYDQPTDFAYWQSQPPAARLAALEAIRCEYHGWRHGFIGLDDLKKNKQASGRFQDLADLENLQ